MHSANGLFNYSSSLLGNLTPGLYNTKNWSHWRQQMSKLPPAMEIHKPLSPSIWPEFSRWGSILYARFWSVSCNYSFTEEVLFFLLILPLTKAAASAPSASTVVLQDPSLYLGISQAWWKAPSSNSNATKIPHGKLSNTGTSCKAMMTCSATVNHVFVQFLYKQMVFFFFFSLQILVFQCNTIIKLYFQVRVYSDLSFLSLPILSDPPRLDTHFICTSFTSFLNEPQEKQDCSYQPKTYRSIHMSALTMNQVNT